MEMSEKSGKSGKPTNFRQLAAHEIDVVAGGYGGRTKDGVYVVCGSVVVIDGTTYIGGINGPIAMPGRF